MTTPPQALGPVILHKSPELQVRIGWSAFRGEPRLDIREWYWDAGSEEWKPSKKGISIPPRIVEGFVTGMMSLVDFEGRMRDD